MKYIKKLKTWAPIDGKWRNICWIKKRIYTYFYVDGKLAGKHKINDMSNSIEIREK